MLANIIATLSFALMVQAASSSTPTITSASGSNPTVSLFIPDAEPQPLVASVVSVNGATTAFYVNCPPDTDSIDCGMNGIGPGVNLTVISQSIWSYSVSDYAFTKMASCEVKTTASTAVCVESLGPGIDPSPPSVVTTSMVNGSSYYFIPATVTAGQELLTAATASSTGKGSSSTDTTAGNSTSKPNAAVAVTNGGEWRTVLAMVCLGIAGLDSINFLLGF
jgi:hypothetical protein